MLDLDDPVVQFKLSLLDRVLPTEDVIVFGDMYMVEGGYTRYVAEHGARSATLVDSLETRSWQRARLDTPNLDFYKGNFADKGFMDSLHTSFSAGIAFDVLLHQPPLLHCLHLMLERIDKHFVFAHPTLEEQSTANALVFLPGHPDKGLYPMAAMDDEYQVFSVTEVNQSHWIWGITASWMRAALVTEGFEILEEQSLTSLPNPRWTLWGGVAERRSRVDPRHWSLLPAYQKIHEGWVR